MNNRHLEVIQMPRSPRDKVALRAPDDVLRDAMRRHGLHQRIIYRRNSVRHRLLDLEELNLEASAEG